MIAKMKARGFSCSFCGVQRVRLPTSLPERHSARPGVPKQMIGKSAFICNECVERYHEMVTSPEIPNNSPVLTK